VFKLARIGPEDATRAELAEPELRRPGVKPVQVAFSAPPDRSDRVVGDCCTSGCVPGGRVRGIRSFATVARVGVEVDPGAMAICGSSE
jgi:hypothetical protein